VGRPKGLLLPCPLCGEQQATIELHLSDLDTCHCLECDNEFTLADVRKLIASWQAVLCWIDSAPSQESLAPSTTSSPQES